MDMIWILAGWGLFGQIVRSAIGVKKALQSKETIDFWYWIATLILGAIIGGAAGMLSFYVYPEASPLIAFLSGYSGIDFIEGLIRKE